MSFGGTMQRPPSGAGFRPGTGSMVPGTASQRGGVVAGGGVSLNTQVDVKAAPTVREGMRGATMAGPRGTTSGGLGPGRQVTYDRSYFIGLLRPKITELTAEIDRLRGVEDTITRNSTVLVQMQQKQKALTEELTKFKATMADVNFAVEHMTSGDPDAIQAEAQALRLANAETRKAVDKMFLQVKDVEGQTKKLQDQLDEEMRRIDERLQSDPRAYAAYRSSRDELYRVSDQIMQMQQEVRTTARRQESLMHSISQDADKKRAAPLVLDILKKRQLRDELARECSIPIEEEKEQIIRQAKTTTQDIDVLQRQVNEAKESVAEARNRIVASGEDLNEYSGDNLRKYQELQEKDKEMTEFIEQFKDREREEVQKITQLEQSIVGMLENMSHVEQLKAAMPKDSVPVMLDQMGSDLTDKKDQLEVARITFQRLQRQVEEKKQELEKVQELDSRINGEIQVIRARVEQQQQEMQRFADLEGLRREVDQRKRSLTTMKLALTKQRDNLKVQVNILSEKLEAAKKKLNESDVHQALTSQEQKLRLIWQSAFALEDFVRMKEKESNYTATKAECLRTCDEIHTVLRDPKRMSAAIGSVGFQ